MIDIHAHILPGLDDGAEDLQDTLQMAKIAVENGVRAMVATPHCNIPGVYDNYNCEDLQKTYVRVARELEFQRIPLNLYLGMEVFATPDLPALIEDGRLLTINNSKYMLMEFPFDEDLEYADDILRQVVEMGIRPVIAHAERYEFVQKNLFILDEWKRLGILIQVNKGSLSGRFGRYSYNAAHYMMRKRIVDVIASDCHRPYHRTPHMMDTYAELERKYPLDYLEKVFSENPEKICLNQEVETW